MRRHAGSEADDRMRETQAPTGGEVRGWQREALPLVAARIPARARVVVECGCGDGSLGALFLRRAPGCRWYGFDRSETALAVAAERLSAVGRESASGVLRDFFCGCPALRGGGCGGAFPGRIAGAPARARAAGGGHPRRAGGARGGCGASGIGARGGAGAGEDMARPRAARVPAPGGAAAGAHGWPSSSRRMERKDSTRRILL